MIKAFIAGYIQGAEDGAIAMGTTRNAVLWYSAFGWLTILCSTISIYKILRFIFK